MLNRSYNLNNKLVIKNSKNKSFLRKNIVSSALFNNIAVPTFIQQPINNIEYTQSRKEDNPIEVELLKAPKLENTEWSFNDFIEEIDSNNIEDVYFVIDQPYTKFITKEGQVGYVQLRENVYLVEKMIEHNVHIHYINKISETVSAISKIINTIIQIIGFIILFRIISIVLGQSKNSPFSFSKSPGKKYDEETEVSITFNDVAGIENAKEDLMQIIDFLNNAENYIKLGARIPKGVLLSGPPGVGKTLLARAVAGEAKVPFISCSASEFIELFVGVGASRVRELFKQAQEKTPCIIFIDELDAIGGKRSASINSNDERDQTINQLLTEMDGFTDNKGVIIIAATNRPDLLDNALTRPGRFDRRINVELPNNKGRKEILDLYLKKKPITEDVDISKLAKMTTGFSGAQLENLCNESAIYAARNKLDKITQNIFENTLDKLTLGAETKTNLITEEKKRTIAYHEAGHTILGLLVSDYDNFRKVSIVSRGSAGGITFFEPKEERVDMGLYTKEYLRNQLIVMMGGRVAEELIFGKDKITTGASNDIMRATELASDMVSNYGFNEGIGPINITNNYLNNSSISDIGLEVKYLLDDAYKTAYTMIKSNKKVLHSIANELIEKETLDLNDIIRITSGKLKCNI